MTQRRRRPVAPSGRTGPGELLIVGHEVGAWSNHRAATARLAAERGWIVTLLMGGADDPVLLTDGSAPTHGVLPVARGWSGPIDVACAIAQLRSAMSKVDVVELVTFKPIVLGLAASRTLRASDRPRIVATFAGLGTVLDGALRARRSAVLTILRLLLRRRARVLVENPDDADALMAARIVDRDDCVVGPGVGLDDGWFREAPNPPPVPDARSIRLLYVGRIIASKGVCELVDAIRILRERGVRAEVVLAGSLDERNPSAIDRSTVDAWMRDGLVRWLGHVRSLVPVYRTADIVVLASHREGRPRALMEAQALGIPVVATDVPGCRQAVDPGRSGLLVPPHDPVALADAIESLASDRSRLAALAAAARPWAERRFRSSAFLEVWASVVLDGVGSPCEAAERVSGGG